MIQCILNQKIELRSGDKINEKAKNEHLVKYMCVYVLNYFDIKFKVFI